MTALPNTDPENGIAYGYVSAQSLHSDLVDDLLYGNGDVKNFIDHSWNSAIEQLATEKGFELPKPKDGDVEGWKTWISEAKDFLEELDSGWADDIQIEESVVSGELEGVHYLSSWLGGALLFCITKSPITGEYARCSPCVPGAGDLDTPREGGFTTYDVPKDWRN